MILEQEKTKKTPTILFDKERGLFSIHGAILPENSVKFFSPLINFALDYLSNPKTETKLDLYIIYFNTSSSKQIYEFIKLFYEAKSDTNITINWLFDEDDEDMEETGREYNAFFEELSFNFLPQA